MKTKTLLPSLAAAALSLCATTVDAAVEVTQSVGWVDGNNGTGDGKDNLHPVVDFNVVNANSILVVTCYVDAVSPTFTNVRFGDGNGIGAGDVAPDASFANSRTVSYLFINPTTASGLAFRADNASGGVAAALYEVSGANTSLGAITTVSGATAIDTTVANELIVGFAGRNGTSAATVNSGSIFTSADLTLGPNIVGGGNLSAAHATATTIGSQNITWNNTGEGLITYAFEPAATGPTSQQPQITSFTSVGGGTWELALKGDANTAFQFRSSTTLDFTSGTLVENLTQGNPGGDPGVISGVNSSVVTTDSNGDATVRLALTGNPADFVRAETTTTP